MYLFINNWIKPHCKIILNKQKKHTEKEKIKLLSNFVSKH